MDLTKNKAVAFFLSYVILKKLDEVNLQLFRKIEKQAKQGRHVCITGQNPFQKFGTFARDVPE